MSTKIDKEKLIRSLLMREARKPHGVRQVAHAWVAAYQLRQTLLRPFELVERSVFHKPVHVKFVGASYHDDVRTQIEAL